MTIGGGGEQSEAIHGFTQQLEFTCSVDVDVSRRSHPPASSVALARLPCRDWAAPATLGSAVSHLVCEAKLQ